MAKPTFPVSPNVVLPSAVTSSPIMENLSESMRQMEKITARRHNPAGWMFERLAKQIRDFQNALDPKEELGGLFVSSSSREPLHIQQIAYSDPDMFIFSGTREGRAVRIVQHYSQLNVEFVDLPAVNDPPYRIGFPVGNRDSIPGK